MIVGIVWPTPFGRFEDTLDPAVLDALHASKATHLRFNADHRNAKASLVVNQIVDAGFKPSPILDLDYQRPDLQAYGDFCEWLLDRYSFDYAEVLNEPKTMEQMSSDTYRSVLEAVGPRLQRFSTKLLVAGDFLRFDKRGPRMDSWLKDVRPSSPAWFDGVAVHPYREPGPPHATRYDTRLAEYQTMQTHFYNLPLVVTEVGWNLRGVTEEQQAAYVYEELNINKACGIEATFIYAHISGEADGFGILGPDLRARPVVAAIARFQEEQGL